jgi:hypothetical protein
VKKSTTKARADGPVSQRPDLAHGDVITHRQSTTREAVVQEVVFVTASAKNGGDRWRVRVLFPQNKASEIGPKGAMVESYVDAWKAVLAYRHGGSTLAQESIANSADTITTEAPTAASKTWRAGVDWRAAGLKAAETRKRNIAARAAEAATA